MAAEVMTLSELKPEGIQDDVSFLMKAVLGRALGRRQVHRGDDSELQPKGIQDDVSFLMNDVLGQALGGPASSLED